MNKFILACLCIVLISCGKTVTNMDLAGEWRFALDPSDKGVSEKWFAKELNDKINLPGSLQEQGFGFNTDVNTEWTGQIVDNSWFTANEYAEYRKEGNIKIPFWLQPQKHYVGVAWYQKEINIPLSWAQKDIELMLERTHWQTEVYLDSQKIGSNDALQTPHRYVLKADAGKHIITVKVDNRLHIPIGINAHSVSDHTQSNWNGITGKLNLKLLPECKIDDVRVFPDVVNRKVKVAVELSGVLPAKIEIQAKGLNFQEKSPVNSVKAEAVSKIIEIELPLGDDMQTWSEFNPALYELTVKAEAEKSVDINKTTFGMREFKANGSRFEVNGIPVFLRGTLECAIFPLTGYASMDNEYWAKIYDTCKNFGINHMRFHSWCPPKVAFEEADKAGIYLQVECGGWTEVGNGDYIDKWFYAEGDRILKEFGNHPSFCMMAYGNEPGGSNQGKYLGDLVKYWQKKDNRRVYTSAGGWPYLPEADYYNSPDPRIQRWGEGLNSIINLKAPSTDYDFRQITEKTPGPVVSHEIGQWCVYPDLNETDKYTGVLKAKNFEIFRETLRKNNLTDLAEEFLYASGRLQTLCYKADIEAALRTPGFAGFQLLDLHDFPGQGTALVGVLNPFWETKGYVDGAEFRNFCNSLTPLVRMTKQVYLNNESFKASVEVANFTGKEIKNAEIIWKLDNKGKTVAERKSSKDLIVDNCIKIDTINTDLEMITEPSELELTVSVNGMINKWNIWVYPSKKQNNKVYSTSNINEAFKQAEAGKDVLFLLPGKDLKPEKGGNIKVGFSSIFWNTAWTNKTPPHVLGVYCNPNHNALALFPNKGHSDYQWWDIVSRCVAVNLEDFPAEYRPIVHLIDDWFTNRKLGILFEGKYGKGKILVCSADLISDINLRPAAAQFRNSIENYMISDKFNPAENFDKQVLLNLLSTVR